MHHFPFPASREKGPLYYGKVRAARTPARAHGHEAGRGKNCLMTVSFLRYNGRYSGSPQSYRGFENCLMTVSISELQAAAYL